MKQKYLLFALAPFLIALFSTTASAFHEDFIDFEDPTKPPIPVEPTPVIVEPAPVIAPVIVEPIIDTLPLEIIQNVTNPNATNMSDNLIQKMSPYNFQIPVEIPMRIGYHDGQIVRYIVTDSSESNHAELISKQYNWQVSYSPELGRASLDDISKTYIFVNGIKGTGIHGFQPDVFTAVPGDPTYSPLKSHVHVIWAPDVDVRTLVSEYEIRRAASLGLVFTYEQPTIINMPFITWPEIDSFINENTQNIGLYYGNHIRDIDFDANTVTFTAQRVFGFDGKTQYVINADTSPKNASRTIFHPNFITSETYQFENGIISTGTLGFQPNLINHTDIGSYSPLQKVISAKWANATSPALLLDIPDLQLAIANNDVSINHTQNIQFVNRPLVVLP